MTRRALFLGLVFAAFAGQDARAERRALLIGVGDYGPEARALAPPLQGPGNDVALLATTLRAEWGEGARIALLTDRPDLLDPALRDPAIQSPTRAAILAALEALVVTTAPGDEVFVSLSGHGAQIPAPPQDTQEADGLDEIFLPADFRLTRNGDVVALENTLADDVLGGFAAAIARRGGFLWLVVDACHAGSMLRGGEGGATPRRLDLAAPGLRVVDLTPRMGVLGQGGQGQGQALDGIDLPPATGGGFVGFFAAPPGTLAYETPFADGTASRVHGVLTWSLVAALRGRDARSYGDLARDLGARLWGLKGVAAAPVFAGDLAAWPMAGDDPDQSDLSARDPASPRRAALHAEEGALVVLAGRIDGVRPGLRLPLRRSGDAPEQAPLAIAEVTEAGIDRARLRLPPPTPALDAALREEGLDPNRFRDRWLADRAADLRADLPGDAAEPVSVVPPPGPIPLALDEALRTLAATPSVVVLAGPAANPAVRADLRLELAGDALRIIPAEGEGGTVPSIRLAGLDAEAIEAALRRRVRAQALLAVGQAFAGSQIARTLRVVLRRRPAAEAQAGPCPPVGGDLRPGPGDPLIFDSAGLIQRGVTRHCDLVFIEATNGGAGAIDLSAFYLDPVGGVFFLDGYAGSALGGLRVPHGETRALAYVEDLSGTGDAPAPAGSVTLLLLATPADLSAPAPRDFRYLQAQPAAAGALRGAGTGDALAELLAGAAFLPSYRSAASLSLRDQAGAAIVPLLTVRDAAGETQ